MADIGRFRWWVDPPGEKQDAAFAWSILIGGLATSRTRKFGVSADHTKTRPFLAGLTGREPFDWT